MHERAGTRSGNISPLQLFALLTIAGAVFIKTAPHIGPLTTAPKSDNPATIAEATPDKPSGSLSGARRIAEDEAEERTARAWVQPRDAAQPPEGDSSRVPVKDSDDRSCPAATTPRAEAGIRNAHLYRATAARCGTEAYAIGRPASA